MAQFIITKDIYLLHIREMSNLKLRIIATPSKNSLIELTDEDNRLLVTFDIFWEKLSSNKQILDNRYK